MNTPGRSTLPWSEVEPLLDEALELDPPARAAWLASLAVARPQVAQAISALLDERDALDSAGFLVDSPFDRDEELEPVLREVLTKRALRETNELASLHSFDAESPLNLTAGAVIGPYRLIREIGRGGMSVVWLAERSDGQPKRAVALKLPVTGPRMPVERFLRERDLLASLTHANIARLYDTGITERGQPYLAMEYVAGTGLMQHCDARRLTVRQRLRLFMQVLDAMQFAHGELIIHRDLKPSNLLVTEHDRVVVLDFGIGKLLTEDAAHEAHLTQFTGRALTPNYASPEQVAGKALGAPSDIYSLGVILYELLAGTAPYRPKRDSRAALEDAILLEDPRRPSQTELSRDAASARSTSVHALSRALAGDLDTIVLKALKKTPAERYASVTALANDIESYLADLPVSARPDTTWYRAGRFVSRHRIPVAAAALAVLGLATGMAVAVWQARAAQAQRDRAVAFAARNEAVTEFLGRVMTEAAESETPVTVSELLARSERLALTDTGDSPENRAAVLEVIADRYNYVEDPARARTLLEGALALLENSPDRLLRARLTCKLGEATADLGQAADGARAITSQLAGLDADPETAAQCLLNLAWIHVADRRPQETVLAAQQGLARSRETGRASMVEGSLMGLLAYGQQLSGRNDEAQRTFAAALQKFRDLGRERSPAALVILNNWGITASMAGTPKRALELYDAKMNVETAREPGATPLPVTVGNRARSLEDIGRFEQARAAYELQCRLAERREHAASRVSCMLGLASVALQTHGWREAEEHLRLGSELATQALPANRRPTRWIALLHGRLDLQRGRLTEARAHFERVLAQPNLGWSTYTAHLGLAQVSLAQGDAAEAVRQATSAREIATRMQGGEPNSELTGRASLVLATALLSVGDTPRAKLQLDAAVTQLSTTVEADHPALVEARELLTTL